MDPLKTGLAVKKQSFMRVVVLPFIVLIATCFTMNTLLATPRESIRHATQMIEKGNSTGAYNLLEPLEDDYAGWWEYDYVLGIAALESGQPNLAILALQRALAMNSRLAGVHIDLGRAYYEVNEYRAAKTEFELALAKKPNPAAARVAKAYIRLLTPTQRSKPTRRTTFNFFIASTGGYDTNANSATNAKTFEGFTLAQDNIQQSSIYVAAKTGMQGALKISKKDSAIFSLDYTQRKNRSADIVNFTSLNALAFWKYQAKYLERSAGIQLQKTDIAANLSSLVTSFTYSQSLHVIKALYFDLFSSLSDIDFGTELSTRDAMQVIGGAGFSIKPKNIYVPTFHISSLAGKYQPKERDSNHEKYLLGGRITLNQHFKLLFRGSYSLSAGGMYSDYTNLFSTIDRKELLVDGVFNISLTPSRRWELFFNSAFTKNLSTVALFDYSRMNTSAGIKYTF